GRDCGAARSTRSRRPPQTASIARDDCRVRSFPFPSFGLLLRLRHVFDQLLRLADLLDRELPGLDHVGHDEARAAAEELQDLIEQAAADVRARDRGVVDLGVADLAHAAHDALLLHALHRDLHGRVGRALGLREGLLNFPDGEPSLLPEGFEDLQLQRGELRRRHRYLLLTRQYLLYSFVYSRAR